VLHGAGTLGPQEGGGGTPGAIGTIDDNAPENDNEPL